MIKQKPINDFEPIESMVMESLFSKAIIFALKIGIFECLEEEQDIKNLSSKFKIPEQKLEALLELFIVRNLLVKINNNYKNSSLASEYLVLKSIFYQGELLEIQQIINENVMNNIETLFEPDKSKPEKCKYHWDNEKFLFCCKQYSLRGSLQDTVELIVSLPGFNNMFSMCDIGGNHGMYSLSLLAYNPSLQATIADLPNITPYITNYIASEKNSNRISVLPFNLRTDHLPEQSFDLILISHVLHMFINNLEEIIEKISFSLKSGGWLVCQQMNPDGSMNEMYKTSRELMTRLMGHTTHFVEQEYYEAILENAGFGNIIIRKSGYNNENLLIASQII